MSYVTWEKKTFFPDTIFILDDGQSSELKPRSNKEDEGIQDLPVRQEKTLNSRSGKQEVAQCLDRAAWLLNHPSSASGCTRRLVLSRMEEEVVPTTYSWWNAYNALGSSLIRVFRRLWVRNGLPILRDAVQGAGGHLLRCQPRTVTSSVILTGVGVRRRRNCGQPGSMRAPRHEPGTPADWSLSLILHRQKGGEGGRVQRSG